MPLKVKHPKQRVGVTLAETETVVDSVRRTARQIDSMHRKDIDPARRLIDDGVDEDVARARVKSQIDADIAALKSEHNGRAEHLRKTQKFRAERAAEMLEDTYYYVDDIIYNTRQELELKCAGCGISSWKTFHQLQTRDDKGLPAVKCNCHKRDLREEQVQSQLPGGWMVSDVPRNIMKPMTITCPGGHVTKPTMGNWNARVAKGPIVCPKCAPVRDKTEARLYEALRHVPAGWSVEGAMERATDTMKYICPNGHEYNMTISNLRKRLREDGEVICKRCAGTDKRMKEAQDE